MHSPIENLRKIIKLERDRGYDNRAVVGGLEKILPAWEIEARFAQVQEDITLAVITHLREYSSFDQDNRVICIDELLKILEAVPEQKPVVERRQPRPENRQHQAEPVQPPQPPADRRPAVEVIQAPVPVQPVPAEDPSRSSYAQRRAPAEAKRPSAGLNAPLTVVQGIGPKHAQTLGNLGLNSLEDLLYYFPRRYDDYSQLKPINRLAFGEEVTVIGTIQAINTRPIRGGAMQLTEAILTDGTGSLRLSWFNKPWFATQYRTGSQVVVSGKLDQYLGRLVMNSPEVEEIEREHLHTNRIVPIYPLTASITQKWLRRLMFQTVNFWSTRLDDFLPAPVQSALKLLGLGEAIQQAHFPDTHDLLEQARWRLAFDEIFLLQLGVMRQKRSWQSAIGRSFETPEEWLEAQISILPFALTGAQRRALAEIRTDLSSGRPMDRLLQGDVGSGKTVVAALAIAMVTRHGAQAAIMAPTGILAEQHYRSLTRLLATPDENGAALLQPEQIRLLVGDTRAAEKQDIRDGLADGSIKLIIGTHTLIEDPVIFNDLELVVIDEQHRFGVAQRAALRSKGTNPHLLVMTATPIPRSLALTIYGDLELLVMDEMPPGRQPIDTHVLHPLERERAYQLIRGQVGQGRQAFIIYPLVEQGENEEQLAAVEDHTRLQKEIFPNLKIGLLHGRMKPDEKDDIMRRFRDGEFNILVSTSVVEVGVDVPNATVMIIEGANRFGLAQLHQFRGRVGRGDAPSFCLLIPDKEDALENERLSAMVETNDGFVLAERDLQQRGPGEFLGTRQAGYSELRMASLTDVHLIEKARQQAQWVFQDDPDLEKYDNQLLAAKLNRFWGDGRGDVS
jgi:ATP-dependent DNA helicase RecG